MSGETFCALRCPASLKTDNAANLVSQKLEEFLAEHSVKRKRTIPYWLTANGEIKRQNRTLLKAMRAVQVEGKSRSRELQKFFLAYRSIPHATTGVSPAEQLFGRKIHTNLVECEGEVDGCHAQGTTYLAARDDDAENKQRVQDRANKGPLSPTWSKARKCSCGNRDSINCLRRSCAQGRLGHH